MCGFNTMQPLCQKIKMVNRLTNLMTLQKRWSSKKSILFHCPRLLTNQFLCSTSAPILGSGPNNIFGPRAKLSSKNQPFFDEIRRILQVPISKGPFSKSFRDQNQGNWNFLTDVTYFLRLNERHGYLFLYMTFIELKPKICPLSSFHA